MNNRRRIGNIGSFVDVLTAMRAYDDMRYYSSSAARLVLVEQSGAKHDIPQPSTSDAMVKAQQAMHRLGGHLREIKVVSHKDAIARWRSSDIGWRRVA
jgi:hypothetical protein